MNKTGIGWTDYTENTVTGCKKKNRDCTHCWPEGIAEMRSGTKLFPNGFKLTFHPERLDEAKKVKTPSLVFIVRLV
jgi:protein gp37